MTLDHIQKLQTFIRNNVQTGNADALNMISKDLGGRMVRWLDEHKEISIEDVMNGKVYHDKKIPTKQLFQIAAFRGHKEVVRWFNSISVEGMTFAIREDH